MLSSAHFIQGGSQTSAGRSEGVQKVILSPGYCCGGGSRWAKREVESLVRGLSCRVKYTCPQEKVALCKFVRPFVVNYTTYSKQAPVKNMSRTCQEHVATRNYVWVSAWLERNVRLPPPGWTGAEAGPGAVWHGGTVPWSGHSCTASPLQSLLEKGYQMTCLSCLATSWTWRSNRKQLKATVRDTETWAMHACSSRCLMRWKKLKIIYWVTMINSLPEAPLQILYYYMQ